MITSLQFKNFKVLRDATLPLSQFTLIVGPNGSGKSTVLKALPLLARLQQSTLSTVVSAGQSGPASITANWNGEVEMSGLWSSEAFPEISFRNLRQVFGNQQADLQRTVQLARLFSFLPQAIAAAVQLPGEFQ